MAYTDETQETQALLDNYANNLRATLGSLARLVNTSEALQDQYNQEIDPVISSWNAGDLWPNEGGLAGASIEETQAQMIVWQSYLDTLLTSLGTAGHKAQYVSAAGAVNTLGAI